MWRVGLGFSPPVSGVGEDYSTATNPGEDFLKLRMDGTARHRRKLRTPLSSEEDGGAEQG